MTKTEMLLTQQVKLLTEILNELRSSGKADRAVNERRRRVEDRLAKKLIAEHIAERADGVRKMIAERIAVGQEISK